MKENIFRHYLEDWGIGITVSREYPLDYRNLPYASSINTQRHRERHSFLDFKPGSLFQGYRIDLSIVRSEGKVGYEIEMEILCDTNTEIMSQNILTIYGWIHNVIKKEQILAISIQKDIIQKIHRLLQHSDDQYMVSDIAMSEVNKPVNLNLEYYQNHKSDYCFTIKYDGSRALCLIDHGKAYLYTFSNNVLYLGQLSMHADCCLLLDGEWMENENCFYCFDIISFNNEDIRRYDFNFRRKCLKTIEGIFTIPNGVPNGISNAGSDGTSNGTSSNSSADTSVNEPNSNSIEGKILKYKKYYSSFRECYIEYVTCDKPTDGIICQPISVSYLNSYTYKWKSSNNITIDFLCHKSAIKQPDDKDEWIEIYSFDLSNPTRYCKFTGLNNDYDGRLYFNDNSKPILDGQSVDGRIVECAYRDGKFVPLKFRNDKSVPNAIDVARNIYSEILHGINLDLLLDNSNNNNSVVGSTTDVSSRKSEYLHMRKLEQPKQESDAKRICSDESDTKV
jgi:hypothetical protein